MQASIDALGKKDAGQAAVAAFGRILDGFMRRASGWPEVAALLDSVPMHKVSHSLAPRVLLSMQDSVSMYQAGGPCSLLC